MMNRLRRLREIGVRDWWLMARVFVVASILPIMTRLCSVPRLLRLCAAGAPRPPADVARVVTCVDRVLGRHPGLSRSPCLRRSLTLYRFLGATATDLHFCLGVRYTEDPHPARPARRLAGHAWLVRNGVPILEGNHQRVGRFRVIYRYPKSERSVAP
jgi:hypothetical protein